MEADATRPRDERPARRSPEVRVVAQARPAEGRVRAALRCPYCHDQVTRQGALACARRGCGALYHRECWDEVARWDGCAALGCGSRDAREVSALGFLVRVARLVLAALLFPRRVAQALRANEGQGAGSIFRQALGQAWRALPSFDDRENGPLKFLLHMVVVGPAVIGSFALLLRLQTDWVCLLFPVVAVLATLGAAFVLALVLTLAFYALRALALAFRQELAAFGRLEAPARSTPKDLGK
ncbi:MAG: hypothetical protein M9894_38205 [Planctomycetes bacterium]|nr:hypothetical protein [Planctomycetota bacterium]